MPTASSATRPDDPEERNILRSILRVLVKDLDSNAEQAFVATLAVDLDAARSNMKELEGESQVVQHVLELIIVVGGGFVLTTGASRLVSWLSGNDQSMWIAVTVITLIALCLFLRIMKWILDGTSRKLLRTNLKRVSKAYSIHSGLHLQQQRERHRRFTREAALGPLEGRSWQEIAQQGLAAELRDSLDDIAKSDRRVLLDKEKFVRDGGEFSLAIQQAVLWGKIPSYVWIYIEQALTVADGTAQEQAALKLWRRFAFRLLNAFERIDDRFHHQRAFSIFPPWLVEVAEWLFGPARNRQLKRRIREHLKGVTRFSKDDLQRLLATCQLAPFHTSAIRPDIVRDIPKPFAERLGI